MRPVDLGKKISVRVSVKKAGAKKVTKTSKRTRAVLAGNLAVKTPKIVGDARIGAKLTASPGNWGSSVKYSYQWLRGSATIAGATKKSYTLTSDDAGKKITVKVTAVKRGYKTAARNASSVKVNAPTPGSENCTLPTASPGSTQYLRQLEDEVFCRVNAERTSRGLPEFERGTHMTAGTRGWAQLIASSGNYEHSTNAYWQGLTPKYSDPSGRTGLMPAENLMMHGSDKGGYLQASDAEFAVSAWMYSSGHCRTVLSGATKAEAAVSLQRIGSMYYAYFVLNVDGAENYMIAVPRDPMFGGGYTYQVDTEAQAAAEAKAASLCAAV